MSKFSFRARKNPVAIDPPQRFEDLDRDMIVLLSSSVWVISCEHLGEAGHKANQIWRPSRGRLHYCTMCYAVGVAVRIREDDNARAPVVSS